MNSNKEKINIDKSYEIYKTSVYTYNVRLKKNNINFSIKKDKTWSGYGGLISNSIKSTINFLEIGRFIKNIKVAKSRSEYFGGFDKQNVLLGILEFIKRRKNNILLRNKNRTEINYIIREIILNKEYKSPNYYIKYFK